MKPSWIVCILNKRVDVSKLSTCTLGENLNATLRSCENMFNSWFITSWQWWLARVTSYIRARPRSQALDQWASGHLCSSLMSARSRTQRRSCACARLPTVNRCLNVMRCPRPSCAAQRRPGSTAFSRFWPKFVESRRALPPCVVCRVDCVSGVRRSDRRGFFLCACDTDKRPRRVHVTRMLPGKEDSR